MHQDMHKEVERRVAEELQKKQRAEEAEKERMSQEKMQQQQQAAWKKIVDCQSNTGWCVCDGQCMREYFKSLSPEDQKAIKTAQKGGMTREKWVDRGDDFHNKHKNGKAERDPILAKRRLRDHELLESWQTANATNQK